jgi:hypothetical protein
MKENLLFSGNNISQIIAIIPAFSAIRHSDP